MELGKFTPISHSLAQEVGLVCAAIYGQVWRYCQMEEGACRASMETMGDEIGVDRATVLRNIKKLCELGYLIDQTPGRRNAPHTYILGKSVAERNTLEDKSVVIRNSSEPKSVAYNNSSTQTVAERNATVAESHLKIDSKETIRDSEKNGKHPVEKVDSKLKQEMVYKLSEVCKIKLSLASGKQRGQLGTAAESLVKIGVGPPQLDKFGEWWAANDWRGKQNQAPEPHQVCEEWGRFEGSSKSKIPRITAL